MVKLIADYFVCNLDVCTELNDLVKNGKSL
jgi:hypothetical protein